MVRAQSRRATGSPLVLWCVAIIAAVWVTVMVTPVMAIAYRWRGAAGTDWIVASNWIPVGVPSSDDTVTINGGSIPFPIVTGSVQVRELILTNGGSVTTQNGLPRKDIEVSHNCVVNGTGVSSIVFGGNGELDCNGPLALNIAFGSQINIGALTSTDQYIPDLTGSGRFGMSGRGGTNGGNNFRFEDIASTITLVSLNVGTIGGGENVITQSPAGWVGTIVVNGAGTLRLNNNLGPGCTLLLAGSGSSVATATLSNFAAYTFSNCSSVSGTGQNMIYGIGSSGILCQQVGMGAPLVMQTVNQAIAIGTIVAIGAGSYPLTLAAPNSELTYITGGILSGLSNFNKVNTGSLVLQGTQTLRLTGSFSTAGSLSLGTYQVSIFAGTTISLPLGFYASNTGSPALTLSAPTISCPYFSQYLKEFTLTGEMTVSGSSVLVPGNLNLKGGTLLVTQSTATVTVSGGCYMSNGTNSIQLPTSTYVPPQPPIDSSQPNRTQPQPQLNPHPTHNSSF